MNLSEALNAALPELPAYRLKTETYTLDPDLVVRQQTEEARPVMMTYKRGLGNLYRFSPDQWALLQWFDGQRSTTQISEEFARATGLTISPEDLRTFAEGLEESDFWYKSPQEKNIALQCKHKEARQQHVTRQSKYGDVSHMQFSAWDPDVFLGKAYHLLRWAYSRWFTVLTLALFVFTLFVFIDRWGEIGGDTLKYYNFTTKSFADLAEFWLLFLVIGFFHESAHGLTCKHFGGGVHSMGFHLIYLTPAFFVDVTEVFVFGGKWERLATILAGIWIELLFCGAATVVWWFTIPGTLVHDFSYKVMLITGLAVILLNVNPLIKLDGYFAFCEIIGIPEIKERSTAFFSSWMKRKIWRLPVEVEAVSRRRHWYFVTYAVLSGVYSYLLLFAVIRFARNIFAGYTPDWAFILAGAIAYRIFRSRLRTLGRFMKALYLDKKAYLLNHFSRPRLAGLAVLALILLALPLWPDAIAGRFVLEPAQKAVVRASVPGMVTGVSVGEGQIIAAGTPVAQLSNLQLQSAAAQSESESSTASARATQAQLQYANFGKAEREHQRLLLQSRQFNQQLARLQVISPLSGTVLTPRPRDLEGKYLPAGETIFEVGDLSRMRARIYVPEFEIRKLKAGDTVRLLPDSFFRAISGQVESFSAESSEMPQWIAPHENYQGIHPPRAYICDVWLLNNDGRLRDGMTGTAKIYPENRKSTLALAWRTAREFVGRKIW